MKPSRVFVYPVDKRHSTVLGYGTKSQTGKRLWEELHWKGAWKDGGTHILNLAGGQYLHVRVKPLSDQCSYRVRCVHCIGSRWRGGIVQNAEVKKQRGQWRWRVTVSEKSNP